MPQSPPSIYGGMPKLGSAALAAASWQCQRCSHTNSAEKNKRRCFSCQGWRDRIAPSTRISLPPPDFDTWRTLRRLCCCGADGGGGSMPVVLNAPTTMARTGLILGHCCCPRCLPWTSFAFQDWHLGGRRRTRTATATICKGGKNDDNDYNCSGHGRFDVEGR